MYPQLARIRDKLQTVRQRPGELVLELRTRLRGLPAGTVYQVRTSDPGAPEDIPAWCRLTGHSLVSADHPTYLIRCKGAWPMPGKLCVSLNGAKDNADRATVAFAVANAALGSDQDTMVFLSTEGVRLAVRG